MARKVLLLPGHSGCSLPLQPVPSAANINHVFQPLIISNINHVVFMLNSEGLGLRELSHKQWASAQLLLRAVSRPELRSSSQVPCGFCIV